MIRDEYVKAVYRATKMGLIEWSPCEGGYSAVYKGMALTCHVDRRIRNMSQERDGGYTLTLKDDQGAQRVCDATRDFYEYIESKLDPFPAWLEAVQLECDVTRPPTIRDAS